MNLYPSIMHVVFDAVLPKMNLVLDCSVAQERVTFVGHWTFFRLKVKISQKSRSDCFKGVF